MVFAALRNSRFSRWGRACSTVLVLGYASGCTCSRQEPSPTRASHSDAGVGSGARRTKAAAADRCTQAPARHTLRALGNSRSGDNDEYAAFAVEVGAALVEANGFWVPWLSSDGKSSQVGIAVLGRDLLTSRSVDLGEVKWDAGPPRLARLNAHGVLAAVPDSDANGGSYRVARVDDSGVVWGADVDGSSDDSPAFDIAASGERALLVWDDYSREQGRGTIRANLLTEAGQLQRDLGSLSPTESDVELPRLVQRRGGYWLAWLRVEWQTQNAKAVAPSEALQVVDPEQPVLTPKARWIEVVPVDTAGAVTAAPVRVSKVDAMVQGYDLQAGHEGALLVTWREDFSNSGTSGGQVWVARLTPDGSVEQYPIKSVDVGGTLPVFLFDPKAPSGVPHGWLTLESERGETALAGLSPFGKPLEPLEPSTGIGNASILAALDGQLLVAEPKGRDMTLKLVRCKYEPNGHARDAGSP